MSLSVVICTHNPHPVFLQRTLDALRQQDLPRERWELLLIDNASPEPLQPRYDLSWHPRHRHIREDELGIAAARIRGMREARTDLILYVDDDNLLAPDYARRGLAIAETEPGLGCFGGQLLPEFEEEPPAWTRQWWSYLAIRPLARDLRTASPSDYDAIPPTAGMFLRRKVWENYLGMIQRDPRHLVLGLRGNQRISGQDTDIALCTFEVGGEAARFAALELIHIMPRKRLSEAYLLRMVESISSSTVVLEGLRGRRDPQHALGGFTYWREYVRAFRLPRRQRLFYLAELRGRRRGLATLRQLPVPSH